MIAVAVMCSRLLGLVREILGGVDVEPDTVDAGRLATLFEDAARLDVASFGERHGLPRRYPAASTAWFERVLTLRPRWNRLTIPTGR